MTGEGLLSAIPRALTSVPLAATSGTLSLIGGLAVHFDLVQGDLYAPAWMYAVVGALVLLATAAEIQADVHASE